jgi:hypothetical protein
MYVVCTAQDIYGEKCSCKRNAILPCWDILKLQYDILCRNLLTFVWYSIKYCVIIGKMCMFKPYLYSPGIRSKTLTFVDVYILCNKTHLHCTRFTLYVCTYRKCNVPFLNCYYDLVYTKIQHSKQNRLHVPQACFINTPCCYNNTSTWLCI